MEAFLIMSFKKSMKMALHGGKRVKRKVPWTPANLFVASVGSNMKLNLLENVSFILFHACFIIKIFDRTYYLIISYLYNIIIYFGKISLKNVFLITIMYLTDLFLNCL